jgi:hypothetical protein
MANTNLLKSVEPLVRRWAADRFQRPIEDGEVALELISGGHHKFDVVSVDRTLIGGVKANRARPDGTVGTGVIKSLFTELYFLTLIEAEVKLLFLTDPALYQYFLRQARGRIAPGIEVVEFTLPEEMTALLAPVHEASSGEIGKRIIAPEPSRNAGA